MRGSSWIGTVLLTLTLINPGVSAAAQSTGPGPRIVKLTWTTRPLTVGAEEVLEIRAVDPDGVVTTANVLWGDGVFTHADLICFGEGEVVRVLLSNRYARQGIYPVRVWVDSGPRCFTTEQTSPVQRKRALVRPAS